MIANVKESASCRREHREINSLFIIKKEYQIEVYKKALKSIFVQKKVLKHFCAKKVQEHFRVKKSALKQTNHVTLLANMQIH